MFKSLFYISRTRWQNIKLKNKKKLLQKSNSQKIIFVSPYLAPSNNLHPLAPEVTFLWSISFLFYLYCFFQPNIIFNLKVIAPFPFRKFKISQKMNGLVFKLQQYLFKFIIKTA